MSVAGMDCPMRSTSRLTLALAAMAAVSGLGAKAHAQGELDQYTLVMEPADGADFDRIRYEMRLTYRDTTRSRHGGFKFVGREPVEGFHAATADGEPLRHSIPSGFRETRLNFDVPPVDDDNRTTAVLTFVQDADYEPGWRRTTLSVPWASDWRIPVLNMRLVLRMPDTVRLACGDIVDEAVEAPAPRPGWRACEVSHPRVFRVNARLGGPPLWSWIVLAIACVLFLVGGRALLVVARD